MKIKEEVTVVLEKIVRVECDVCGVVIDTGDKYDTREFELTFTMGRLWPDGSGNKVGWQVEDLCNDCVDGLRHLLFDNNLPIKEINHDW